MNPFDLVLHALWARESQSAQRVFDWHKAATLILASSASYAEAGLAEDWSATADVILEKGQPYPTAQPYIGSSWATPSLLLNDELIECYILDIPETNPNKWDQNTVWPTSAYNILRARH